MMATTSERDSAGPVPSSLPRGFTPINASACPPVERREDYLADPDVRDFVAFLRALLQDTGALRHAWRHEREGYNWQCGSLLDAVHRYRYRVIPQLRALTGHVDFQSLHANAVVLDQLKTDLRLAIKSTNEPAAQKAATAILSWGGTNRGEHNSRALAHLATTPGGLIGYLIRCQTAFGSGATLDLSPLAATPPGLRSNAGFTKIYSLAFDDFVIYDSRVAAALGLLIVRWRAQCAYASAIKAPIPIRLQLCHLPAMGNSHRDPNDNAFHITGLPHCTGHLQHLQSNVRANWLLVHALHGTHFGREIAGHPLQFPVLPLRALEAALFMIGYDLAGNWPHLT